MINGKKVIAIIPARGGSKRLPRKNVMRFSGKPLIVWTIEAAKKSKYIDRVLVSSDDDEILEVSRKNGAEVPFKRPAELATDVSTSVDVVLHALNYMSSGGEDFDYFVLLQPTSPLRTVEDIDKAFELMVHRKQNGIISVTELGHPIEWVNTLPGDGSMNGFLDKDIEKKRSQDFEKHYKLNGAIYILEVKQFIREKNFYLESGLCSYVMSSNKSLDIDSYEDFVMAEALKNMEE